MPFNRPPRLQTPIPEVVLNPPQAPPIPSKPDKGNWLTVLLPVGAVLLSVVLMFVLMNGNSGSMLNYLIFIPIMLVSYLAAIVTNSTQKKNYKKKVEEGRVTFNDLLSKFENKLLETKRSETQLRVTLDPDPHECIRRAQKSDSRLGERRPSDSDFLHLRLGTGTIPASYRVDTSQKEKIEEFKEEIDHLDKLIGRYSKLTDVPIHARIPSTGSIGISGTRSETLGVSRALISHLLVHHWASEVKVLVISRPTASTEWAWIRKTPHISALIKESSKNPESKSEKPDEKLMAALEVELQRREQQVEARRLMHKDDTHDQKSIPLPRLIIIFDYLPLNYNHPALNLLHKKGYDLGVYGIFLTGTAKDIPGSCGAIIQCENGRFFYNESGPSGYSRNGISDRLGLQQVEALAIALSNIDWPKSEDTSQPPETITFLQLFGVKQVEDLPIKTWWEEKPPYGFLRAPIGRISSTADMVFDLNDKDGAHGPHGLLGGMTGSGKSEVLKALILALAVTHHPYDLNFALIDFKGGAAFNELARLPHTVGVVTDIESNATFAERVIQALSGEIERRKRVLENARNAFRFGRSHIDEYRNLRVRRPMPRLVIVFDEFAEFKQRNPTESKKLISIARQGRSLGVHLILATQNIDAAVDPEILQNSTFRICLKVSEPQDSMQMIGIPDAVNLTRGRAYFSSNTRYLYQSAFSGARYVSENEGGIPNSFVRVWPDGHRESLDVPRNAKYSSNSTAPSTEASAVVEVIVKVARELHLKKTPAVWPDALSDRIYLPDQLNKYLTGGWDGKEWRPCQQWGKENETQKTISPFLGLGDLPVKQEQFPLQLDAARGGHLLIFGSAGSGKSTLLRTLVSSIALTHSPADAQIYILDFGGQSALKLLELFPHVGAVATRLETERAERLVQLIQAEVGRRNNLLRAMRVDSWVDYNAVVPDDQQLPALFLLIDGFKDFKQSFENEFIDGVSSLVSGGQAAGLSLIISASLQNDLPNDLFANINLRLSFNQADPTEYYRIVGQPSEAKLQEDTAKGVRPGRGLLRGNPPIEFQAALPTYGVTDKDQAMNLMVLADQMRHSWKGALPTPVRILPLLVTLPKPNEYSMTTGDRYCSMLGLDFESLAPIGFRLEEDGPTFLVGSTSSQTGKTTLMRSWLLGLAEKYSESDLEVILVDYHSRSMNQLKNLPIIHTYIGNRSAAEPVINNLRNEIDKRQKTIDNMFEKDPENTGQSGVIKNWPHILIMIDDYDRFYQTNDGEIPQLTACVQRAGDLGVSFIIGCNMTELPNNYSDHFIERFRKNGCGVLLGGVEYIDEFNNTRRPVGSQSSGLPAGRGYMINRGRAILFQAAAYWNTNQSREDALQKRVEELS